MDLAFSPEEIAFRAEVEAFVAERLPRDIREAMRVGRALDKPDHRRWQRILHEKGWAAPHWPEEHGGAGWDATRRYLFAEALAAGDAPEPQPFGLQMVGPVIYTFGDAGQQKKFLPAILSGEAFWCQGYSEPGAGSDLASLSTKAVPEGDHYVVNGTKTWTSLAHWADWMFCLVRTSGDGKPQEGISFLLIDMTTPGIEVRPIPTIDGGHHVNMTYFTDVRVPIANRVGEENKGWTYAKFLLAMERTGIAEVGPSKQRLRRLREIAAGESAGTGALIEDDGFRRRIDEVEVDLMALEYTNLRYLAEETAGGDVGARASLLKIRGSELRQRITELSLEALGHYAMVLEVAGDAARNLPPPGGEMAPGQTGDFLYSRAATIYGGTNEIQRNIVAKLVLGL